MKEATKSSACRDLDSMVKAKLLESQSPVRANTTRKREKWMKPSPSSWKYELFVSKHLSKKEQLARSEAKGTNGKPKETYNLMTTNHGMA